VIALGMLAALVGKDANAATGCLEGFDFTGTEQCSCSSMRRMLDRDTPGFPLPTGT
jgi:hypothetical protein